MAKATRDERLAKLRQKMEAVSTIGGRFLSLKQGRNQIRILPEVGDMEYFFQQVGVHYMPDKKRAYCRAFTSDGELECPICEAVEALYSGDKASKKLASDIRVRKQFWMNVIDRDNEDAGPLIFTAGITIMSALSALVGDPDYGNITDIADGIDIKIVKEGTGIDTQYQVMPAPRFSPLSEDDAQIEEWLGKASDMSIVEVSDDPEQDKELSEGHAIYLLPYDRVAREFLDTDDEDEEPPAPKQRKGPANAKKKKAAQANEDEDEEEDEEDEDEEDESPARREVNRRTVQRRRRR